MEGVWAIPEVRAVIDGNRDDRINMVCFGKPGQKLIRALEVFEREMLRAFLA